MSLLRRVALDREHTIIEHLEAGTPLHLLAKAAGVRPASLARYATYAQPVEPDMAERLLALREDAR